MRRLLIAVALLTTACSSPPFIELPNPALGVVVAVDAFSDTFDVELADGQRFRFINAQPDDPGEGTAHMQVHLADRTPVSVTWRRDGFDLVAVSIDDASGLAPRG